jgi:hypothetical protein
MFGLEGSGLIISLGVTLLLCGVIAYYARSKINVLDHKLSSMFQLVSVLTTEINSLSELVSKFSLRGGQPLQSNQPVADNRTAVSESDSEDSNTDSDESNTESEYNNLDIQNNSNVVLNDVQLLTMGSELDNSNINDVKIVELPGSTIHDINLNDEAFGVSSSSSSSSSSEDSELQNNALGADVLTEITLSESVNSPSTSIEVVKMPETFVDYKKHTVNALRKLVKDRGLLENPSKTNKTDLIKLLQ